MELKKVIEARRSIRKYLDKPVSEKLINEVIEAARLAPSGNNAQPSRYVVINSKEKINTLKENNLIRDKWVYDAPVIIVCCADTEAYSKFVEGWDNPNEIRALRDLSIASSYIDLRANDLGLGTCYCGWIKKEEIKKTLNLPDHYIVPYVITLGYPDESPNARPRKEINEIVLQN